MIGGTKQGEIDRTSELFEQILNEQGIYFALMLLVDIGYSREEIKSIADKFKVKK